MNIPITQSKEWQKLQQDLGETSFFEAKKDYQYLAILKHTPVGNYLYLPYGPVADTKRGFSAAIKSLVGLAREQSAIFIRIEPQTPQVVNCAPYRVIPSKNLNPKETWVLDLTGNDEDFKAKLPHSPLYYHRSAARKGVTIKESHNANDIHYLVSIQQSLAKKKKFNTFDESYLKTELSQPFATLYLAEYQNPQTNKAEVIGANLVFDHGITRYTLQGVQSDLGKKLRATSIIKIQSIYDARAKGLKKFDFWGIAPEGASPSHPWYGFTAFKKSFKGEEHVYFGTNDIILNFVKYKLYQILRWANRLRRKI